MVQLVEGVPRTDSLSRVSDAALSRITKFQISFRDYSNVGTYLAVICVNKSSEDEDQLFWKAPDRPPPKDFAEAVYPEACRQAVARYLRIINGSRGLKTVNWRKFLTAVGKRSKGKFYRM